MKQSNIILYSAPKGHVNSEGVFHNEIFWLTQKRVAELFGVEVPAISKHLNNIYETGELHEESTVSILKTVQKKGDRSIKRNLAFYTLDAVIAVGYRVYSWQATQFRIWATKHNALSVYYDKNLAFVSFALRNARQLVARNT